jgi:signal transduction histidine kinase
LEKQNQVIKSSIGDILHDEIGQQLTILKLKISHLEPNIQDQILPDLISIQKNIREIAHDFSKTQVDNLGLITSAQGLINEAEKNSGIEGSFEYSIENELENNISYQLKNLVLNCIQEGLNNIIKHSRASKFLITISIHEDFIDLSIADNGIGLKQNFDNMILTEETGIGLFRIKERIKAFKGSLDLVDSDEYSTVLFITLPIGELNGKN